MRRFLLSCLLLALSEISLRSQSLQAVNGTQLFLQELGKGELVIVLHGGPGMNYRYLLPHLEPLGRRMKLILYDQRASGNSSLPASDSLQFSFHIDDIEQLRLKYKAEKVHILGHSWGAFLAVNYGLRYPNRVKSLILVNPVPLSTEYQRDIAKEVRKRTTKADSAERATVLASDAYKTGKSEAYEKLLRLSFRHSFYKEGNRNRLKVELPANYTQASKALFAGLSKDLTQYDYYGAINGFRFPMLIIHGRYDATPMQSVDRITNTGGPTILSVFESSGHFVFIEENERFITEVTNWVRAKSMKRTRPEPKAKGVR